ncbi:hypothetical protein Daura_37995 [Dactylosporangium aurantiacum]|uniref:TY-Chap N-terminal domain-containing protein n=1 Tax=Dactylosporangium aurantiacum TaxID=35754 RepID=A0A9Q9MFB3_9ACTN|nr:hypothetical protein [Dactylosporangium aurantiacum]MDG6101787.1 hypothetical protein [Dactylosporangium aurantiacum]UWZ52405.1 hypothetical protein Daura_37995 [Dactylosporangium aurantiacum]
MSTTQHPAWEAVTEELAGALTALRAEDAVSLGTGDVWVQFIRFTRGMTLTGPAVFVHTSAVEPGSPAAEGLAGLGWARWDELQTLGRPEVPAPVDPDTAAGLADLIVRTLRDVHGVADPGGLTYSSFNNDGLRAPRLRTVAAEAGQRPADPDPATLLPDPAPSWRQWCAVFADGLGDWSQAAFDRLVAAHGWTAEATGRREPVFGIGDGATLRAGSWDAGHYGHGELSALTVTQPVDADGAAAAYRRALAAAVAVLGHPPLVGDEGRAPFARWRGARTTLTLALVRGTELRLEVEPTEARENLIYHHQKWMMSPDDWAPDELWTTEPDVEAPQAGALLGMMSYPHSPAETLDGTLEELRALLRSWVEALPLLHPYASSARWRLRRPGGDMVAEAAVTPDRVTARFGWSDQYGEPVTAAPNPDVADDVVRRTADALARAGVTEPAQLRGAAWSDTPAERLDAARLTLRQG